jgi:hypothetical protein
VHNRIISAVKRVQFINDRMSYIILRGHWCHIIVQNTHVPTKDKMDDVKDSFYEELERVFNKFPKYHMKILLGDFNAKVGSEDIFKPTIGNESLHKINNNNGVTVVNFTSKNLTVKSTMLLHCNINKHNWMIQIDHTLIDRQRHLGVLDVRSFRAANCDTGHYLMVAKVKERLAMNKQRSHRFQRERFDLKKLNEVERKEQYRVEVSNRFDAL